MYVEAPHGYKTMKTPKVKITDFTTDQPKSNYTINTIPDVSENPCVNIPLDTEQPDVLYQLNFCEKCIQMTNHRHGACLKCKTYLSGVVDESNGVKERLPIEVDEPNDITQDKLMAAFMGIMVRDFKWRDLHTLAICEPDGEIDYMECEFYTPQSNWNQLMQVVTKMEKLGYALTIDPWSVEVIEYLSGKEEVIIKYDKVWEENLNPIDNYYHPVLLFIEWYNKQK